MTAPTGVYDQTGRLVATKHGIPLTLLQDPDTGDRIWVTGTGFVYYREHAPVHGDQADVDRLNDALDEISPEEAVAVIQGIGIAAGVVVLLVAIVLACCSGPA
jgi:tryptophan synthase alpha subunit